MKILLTNDAYHYLRDGEEPVLDEDIEDARKLLESHPQGVSVRVLPEAAPAGMMWCEIAPFFDTAAYDLEERGIRFPLRVRRLAGRKALVWRADRLTGEAVKEPVEVPVLSGKAGDYIDLPDGSRYPLGALVSR